MSVTRAEIVASLALAGIFVVTMALATLLSAPALDAGLQQFDDPEDPAGVGIYLVLILAFTFVILWVAKRGYKWVIRWLILLAVGSSVVYLVYPILLQFGVALESAFIAGLAAAVVVTLALWKHPEWYVIDVAGVAVATIAASVFGISFVPWLVILLLSLLAIYDAIAVYKTRHMLSLADTVIELRLPVLLVIPKHRGYRFRDDATQVKQVSQSPKTEREAMFMGLGDLVMPTMLVVSALVFFPHLAGLPAELTASIGEYDSPTSQAYVVGLQGEVVAEGDTAQVLFTISSTNAPSDAHWTLDWDSDAKVDVEGDGLPAQYNATYTESGGRTAIATVSSEGESASASLDVLIEGPSSWLRPLQVLVHHPPALGAALGTLVGFGVLMVFVLRGNPQAGLPLLNGGSILGFLVGLWMATGSLRFW